MRNGLTSCMTVMLIAVVALPAAPRLARADLDEHRGASTVTSSAAPITVTINPESRVSVIRTDIALPQGACGVAIQLVIRIFNEAYVTAPLQVLLIDPIDKDIKVEFPSEPLKGAMEESRTLRLTLRDPGLTDITISFREKNETPDLGGRDRVHLLAQCNHDMAWSSPTRSHRL